MIVEVTNYFAKEGQASAVLEQRRAATRLRQRLGLKPGQILVKRDGKGPDVRWECAFASDDEFKADMAARGACEEFEQARKTMHTLLERFERHVYVRDEQASP